MKVEGVNKAVIIKKINDDIEIKPLYNINKEVYLFDLIINTIKGKRYIIDININSVDKFDYLTINFKKWELNNNFVKYNFVANDNREVLRVGMQYISSFILFEIKNIKVMSKDLIEEDGEKKVDKGIVPQVQEKRKVVEMSNYIYKKKTDSLLLARSYDYAILVINENKRNIRGFEEIVEKDFWQFKKLN